MFCIFRHHPYLHASQAKRRPDEVAVGIAMVLTTAAVPIVLVLPLLKNAALFFVLVFFVEFIIFLTVSPINIGSADQKSFFMR